ncbi:MAG: TIGR02452 family protein [Eubacterium sp.]|nr:TIGR02452 family protein [Eubacterium sp.]
MRSNSMEMLQETLQIINKGSYMANGKRVKLKLPRKEMEHIHVLLPDNIRDICSRTNIRNNVGGCRVHYNCENMDSFALAQKRCGDYLFESKKEILVLNFANPVNPGGGVRLGARAQEEDLCRKSSLLLSLESRHAAKYYEYNRNLHTHMGSNAMMITPKVEVFRDENGNLLKETFVVAVLTCAAPMVLQGREGMTEAMYQGMVYDRIMSMLKCAAYFGYDYLVLGAWGCGAFGNDAHVISDLFYKAFKEMDYGGLCARELFQSVDFAVLDKTANQYTFKEFYRNFEYDNFYRDENSREVEAFHKRVKKTEKYLDKIRGSLFGGAVGDALGYPVEFMSENEIFTYFGQGGIKDYVLDSATGMALISDDTQMTMFTANGILVADTRGTMRGIGGKPRGYVRSSYLDWLKTQEMTYEESRKQRQEWGWGISWLLDVPELYSLRAPGRTCLSALTGLREHEGAIIESFINHPKNSSKGCGGIMRVAPIALKDYHHLQIEDRDREAAEIAAITHGHSLGYMPAAVLAHIINRIVFPKRNMQLKEIVLEAKNTVSAIFPNDRHRRELENIIDRAIELSENGESDLHNIHRLGEGWVAEETLAIAIYCSLRHQDNFSAGVRAAVNHNGDSDSTGAVTGNILGALLGYKAIDEKWKKNLELSNVILEMADDLCHGCQISEFIFSS